MPGSLGRERGDGPIAIAPGRSDGVAESGRSIGRSAADVGRDEKLRRRGRHIISASASAGIGGGLASSDCGISV